MYLLPFDLIIYGVKLIPNDTSILSKALILGGPMILMESLLSIYISKTSSPCGNFLQQYGATA